MEWDNDNIIKMVTYVNRELSNGRTMVDIEKQDFKVNERVIHKRFLRKGYIRENGKYVYKIIDKSKLPSPPPPLNKVKEELNKKNREDISKSNIKSNIKSNKDNFSIEEVKSLKELLRNKDELLKLLPCNRESVTKSNIRSKKNETKSFRVDTGLYEEFKKKVNKNNDKITSLINSFMEEYIYK